MIIRLVVDTKSLRQTLLQISNLDSEIASTRHRLKQVDEAMGKIKTDIDQAKTAVQSAAVEFETKISDQTTKDNQLKEEQRNIVERRKRLSSLGGTKGAKLLEREIDIAARTVHALEQSLLQALEQTENAMQRLELSKSQLEELNEQLKDFEQKEGIEAEAIKGRLDTLLKEREELIASVEPRVKTTYLRVYQRYQGPAIAIAEGGSCRTCFRALPAQTFNQVAMGAISIQCPGCSRILISVADLSSSN
jgi:predicted  nucleic acid-binding Zn-ribbon protein